MRTKFFDEFTNFSNADYDVSFFRATTAISPDGKRVVHTIKTTHSGKDEIRLADFGKDNPVALRKIKAKLPTLP